MTNWSIGSVSRNTLFRVLNPFFMFTLNTCYWEDITLEASICREFGIGLYYASQYPYVTEVCRSVLYWVIQKERSIFWEVIISVIMRKNVGMNMSAFPNSYRYRAVCISRHKLGWKAKFIKERWVHETNCFLAFLCYCRHKETWRSTQTKNTRSSHKSCKVHWGWRWGFRAFILNCNKLVIPVFVVLTLIKFKV